jgi:hypothetical protein
MTQQYQANLIGQKVEIPATPEEIKAVCCRRCFNAKRDRCKCKCKKMFHGQGNKKQPHSNKLPQKQGVNTP